MKNNELMMTSRNLNYENISTELPAWIAETSLDKWLVIGVSGGIDSAVVSTLAAMTGKMLHVLELPIHQKMDEVNRAREHILWLQSKFSNIVSEIVDLTHVYESMRALQSPWESQESEYLSDVNLRSRLRAVQLYATANRNSAMVLGTGNKVEDYGIGFFTKYWDGAVDLSPIWELYKSEVYSLGRELWISNSILEAQPTDGLHTNGATDEDQIGASYDELEWAMGAYDAGKRVTDYSERAAQVMHIYTLRHESNTHKMHMPPVYSVLDPTKSASYYDVFQ